MPSGIAQPVFLPGDLWRVCPKCHRQWSDYNAWERDCPTIVDVEYRKAVRIGLRGNLIESTIKVEIHECESCPGRMADYGRVICEKNLRGDNHANR